MHSSVLRPIYRRCTSASNTVPGTIHNCTTPQEPRAINPLAVRQLEHARLGHLNNDSMVKMGYQPLKTPSEICLKGEFPSRKFEKVRPFQLTVPLEDVFIDLSGKQITASFGGNWFFLSIIDYYSKYSWIYFLKNKSDAFDAIKTWMIRIRKQIKKAKTN